MLSPITILNIILAFIIFGANGYLWSREQRRFVYYLLALSEVVVAAGLALDVVAIYRHTTGRPFTYGACLVAFVLCGLLAACTSYAVHFFLRKRTRP